MHSRGVVQGDTVEFYTCASNINDPGCFSMNSFIFTGRKLAHLSHRNLAHRCAPSAPLRGLVVAVCVVLFEFAVFLLQALAKSFEVNGRARPAVLPGQNAPGHVHMHLFEAVSVKLELNKQSHGRKGKNKVNITCCRKNK